jgi:GNAT superfamily N-acetyltransferase
MSFGAGYPWHSQLPNGMGVRVEPAEVDATLSLRTRYRQEMHCQIVHDSIHRREGWTLTYLFKLEEMTVGYGSIAVAGPWKEKPTLLEFYLLPEHRLRAFEFFEAFVLLSQVRHLEIQSNEPLLPEMTHTYGRNIESEKIVFADQFTTNLPSLGAVLRALTPEKEVRKCLERRQGGGDWVLDLEGAVVASGGILFHYNRPYGDIYMEVNESHRKRGFGAYLVQELKRECYALGAVPAARCNRDNVASRRTLQKAGFVPCAHMLFGEIAIDRIPTRTAHGL